MKRIFSKVVAIAFFGGAFLSFAQIQPVTEPLAVVDSAGKLVGPVVSILSACLGLGEDCNPPGVVLELQDRGLIVLPVFREFFGQVGFLVFLDPGCTGPAYILTPHPSVQWVPVVVVPPGTSGRELLYAPEKGATPITASVFFIGFDGSCHPLGGPPQEVLPATVAVDLLTIYDPPFEIIKSKKLK